MTYTRVPKIMIICLVAELWLGETSHFGRIFAILVGILKTQFLKNL